MEARPCLLLHFTIHKVK